jgi:signal transduction histidine kinase
VLEGGQKISSIIDELFLLATIQKATDLPRELLDMNGIISAAQRRLMYMIRESDAEILMPDAWPPAEGYAPWVEEVWMNYLSNALKYGGRPPHIELGATAQGNMVRFWVRDNGQGIPHEEQDQLFTQFTRLGDTHVEGHGLGLSIVKRIVDKLGGEVGVESTVGQGSTFCFTLPAADLSADAMA